MANSRVAVLRLTGEFMGGREGDDGGIGGDVDSPLGDANAKVRVSDDAFDGATVRGGKSAQGMLGIGVTFLCS